MQKIQEFKDFSFKKMQMNNSGAEIEAQGFDLVKTKLDVSNYISRFKGILANIMLEGSSLDEITKVVIRTYDVDNCINAITSAMNDCNNIYYTEFKAGNLKFDFDKEKIQTLINEANKDENKLVDSLNAQFANIDKKMKERFFKSLATSAINKIVKSSTNKQDFEKIFNSVLEAYDKDYLANKIPDDYYFTYYDISEEDALKKPEIIDNPYESQIKTLEDNNASNHELIDALNKARKIVPSIASGGKEYFSALAESMGTGFENIKNNMIMNTLNNDSAFNKKIFEYNGSKIEPANDLTIHDFSDCTKIAINQDKVSFDEKTKNDLLVVIDQLKASGIYKYNPNFQTEQSSKLYYMQSLIDKKNAVIKAIETGNPEEIIKTTQEYENLERVYDEIIQKLNELAPIGLFVNNISSSRMTTVPLKYSKDFQGVSRLNGLCMFINGMEQQGIELETFFDDPIKAYKTYIDKVLKEDATNELLKSKNDVVELFEIELQEGNGEVLAASQKSKIDRFNIERVFESAFIFAGTEEKRAKLFELYKTIQVSYFLDLSSAKENDLELFQKVDLTNEQKSMRLAKLIGYEKEDYDIVDLANDNGTILDYDTLEPKNNNINDYINKKGNVTKVLDRVIQLINASKKRNYSPQTKKFVIKSADIITKAIMDKKINASATVITIATALYNETPIHKTDILNYGFEKKYEELKATKTGEEIAEQKDEFIKQLAEVKKAYASRNFLAKIFYSSVRRQNKIIKKMTKNLTDNGVSKDYIDQKVEEYNNAPAVVVVENANNIVNENQANINLQHQLSQEKGVVEKENVNIIDNVNEIENNNINKDLENNEMDLYNENINLNK